MTAAVAQLNDRASPADFHALRRIAILRDAPQIARLFGHEPRLLYSAFLLVAAQFAIAVAISRLPLWGAILAAIVIGAFLAHYLNVVIHEATHNLVLGSSHLDKAVGIFANLPLIFPAAMGFRHYHLLHHTHLGTPGRDPDFAPFWIARLVGHARLRKLVWLMLLPPHYVLISPLQARRLVPLDIWFFANVFVVVGAAAMTLTFFGWSSFAYLAASAYLAVGPHPTGAHILQEHIIFDGSYATASYYGPINAISNNHGCHLEHHDFLNVPGSRLREVRRLARAHYDTCFAHRSRLKTLWCFVMDKRIGLHSRLSAPLPV